MSGPNLAGLLAGIGVWLAVVAPTEGDGSQARPGAKPVTDGKRLEWSLTIFLTGLPGWNGCRPCRGPTR